MKSLSFLPIGASGQVYFFFAGQGRSTNMSIAHRQKCRFGWLVCRLDKDERTNTGRFGLTRLLESGHPSHRTGRTSPGPPIGIVGLDRHEKIWKDLDGSEDPPAEQETSGGLGLQFLVRADNLAQVVLLDPVAHLAQGQPNLPGGFLLDPVVAGQRSQQGFFFHDLQLRVA